MPRNPGLEELIYDPIGSLFSGTFRRGAYGGHATHVHAADDNPWVLLALIRWAQRHNLAVRENPYTDPVDPVHTGGSWHYQTFKRRFGGRQLGKAVDVSGDPARMAAFFRFARRRFGTDTPRGIAVARAAGGQARAGGLVRRGIVPAPISVTPPQLAIRRPADILAALAQPSPDVSLGGMLAPSTTETETIAGELAALRRRLLAA